MGTDLYSCVTFLDGQVYSCPKIKYTFGFDIWDRRCGAIRRFLKERGVHTKDIPYLVKNKFVNHSYFEEYEYIRYVNPLVLALADYSSIDIYTGQPWDEVLPSFFFVDLLKIVDSRYLIWYFFW